MGYDDLNNYAKEIADYERKFRESEAKRTVLECEVAARGYEIEAMYNSLLEQEKIHIEYINLLQQVVDHIPMPIFWKGLDGVCLGCNKSCEQTIGLTKAEIVGKTVFDIFESEYAKIYDNADMETVRFGHYSYSTEFKRIDGTITKAIFHMRIYHNCSGERSGIIVFAHTPCDGKLCP